MVIQCSSRKFQPPLQAPGPWVGTVKNTKGGVHGLVSQEIWTDIWRLISELVVMEWEGRGGIPRARMDSIGGFFVYVSRTYRDMNPHTVRSHIGMRMDIY